MALTDLSLVSETLVRFVDESIKASPAWPGGQTADVCSLPPDLLPGDNSLGIYMYHLSEDPASKNIRRGPTGRAALRFTPMGLNLFFVRERPLRRPRRRAHSGSSSSWGWR